jgi:hypothetical protein
MGTIVNSAKCALFGFVLVSISGCPKCPEGQSWHRTGWVTSEASTSYFSIPGDFGHYYCFTGTTKDPLRQCGWRGDKNFPSSVNCQQRGAADPFSMAGLAKMRILMDCEYATKGLEVRWFDAESMSAVDDGQIRNTLDTGVIDIRGMLCFRNSVNTTAIVEYYFSKSQCDANGTPDSDEISGGRSQSCAVTFCADGSFCPEPNVCQNCQYAVLCLPPGQTCAVPCGSMLCDRTASCLRCPTSLSVPGTDYCAKPTEECCEKVGVCGR